MLNIDELKFDANGLIPAIVQDAKTREVLTLAYMNRESLIQPFEARALAQRRNERKLPTHRFDHGGLRPRRARGVGRTRRTRLPQGNRILFC